jgi:hypothetical protein
MFDDSGTEAEALDDWFSGEEVNDPRSIHYIGTDTHTTRVGENVIRIGMMKAKYAVAKNSIAGAVIECPCCLKRFRKASYQQAFCSNKGRGNCKDKFWNTVDDKRRVRAEHFS